MLANIKTLKDLVEVVSYGEKEANVCEYSIEGKPGRDLRRDLFACAHARACRFWRSQHGPVPGGRLPAPDK